MNFKRTITICLAFMVLLSVFLTGCGNAAPRADGLLDYKLSADQEDAADYEGLIGVPQGDNSPVVFIIHGASLLSGENFTPYYKGFEYLVQALAANGYLAISMDVNKAYTGDSVQGSEYDRVKDVFKTTYERLVEANKGKNNFSVDLKGKADLSKINMIGHSRGGDHVTGLIADPDLRPVSFVSALKVAAAGNSSLRGTYADVPTALVYSQYDEDVPDMAAANYYYYAYNADAARTSPLVSAFVYGANHAAYNTLVTQKGMMDYGDQVSYITPEVQRDFLTQFALDFLSTNNRENAFFDVFNDKTAERYDTDFMLSVHDPMGEIILRPDEYMQQITARDVNLKYLVSSVSPLKNTAGAFNPPGSPDKLPLYKLTWEKTGGSLEIPIDGMFFSLTADRTLSLYLALDSSDALVRQGTPVTFDVILTDAEGNTAVVPFSSETDLSLKYQPGGFNEDSQRWEYFTPLGTALLHLDTLTTPFIADNLVSLTISPTSGSGAIVLAGIDAYTKS